jgi:hypothetical protein
MQATPEPSFHRQPGVIHLTGRRSTGVIEGAAKAVEEDDPRYAPFLEELSTRNRMAAYFTERGHLYCIEPRRLIFMRGFEPDRHIVEFD